ncbi:MAG TPA: hypothetical protein VKU94_04455 [Geobacterales bacterium]|nr:hypothetical protein [Geobacterales bacterium]
MRTVLFPVLNALAALGFVLVDMIAPLPTFLILENLVYSVLFAITIILYFTSSQKVSYLMASIISLFIAGRISRSVISSDGTLLGLWQEHFVAVLLLLIIAFISLYSILKGSSSG